MRFFSKKISFLYPLVIASSALFGQNRETEMTMSQQPAQMQPGYNAPMAPVENNKNYWFDIDAAFTYWEAMQENMELGAVGDVTAPSDTINATFTNMNFEFKPGFTVGAGFGCKDDNWDVFVNYAWFRSTTTERVSLDSTNYLESFYPAWTIPQAGDQSFFGAKETWTVNMDIIDSELGRAFYVGKRLTCRPFIGLRAPFIRQKVAVRYSEHINDSTLTTYVNESTQSWGLGPRAGFGMNWELGRGFAFYGKGAADIVYTEYTSLNFQQKSTGASGSVVDGSMYTSHQSNLGYARTHMDMTLGFAWNTKFDNDTKSVDLRMDYGFQVFFSQNMFRNFLDDQAYLKSTAPNGNLYLQGLTVTLGFAL